jgi:DNA polymerase elongation subunit (family B)
LFVGNYVRFDVVGNTINPYREGAKFEVKEVLPKSFVIEPVGGLFEDLTPEEKKCLEWSFTKDDVSPQELFQLHEGTPEDRARIAKYCIQDCDLVLTLMAKLDILTNARGMADVCFIPLQYLFLRGQGIKIFSRVAYEASQRNQILLMQENMQGDSSYEGAIVISPKIGMYLDTPVAVLDYNSLYPSSMIGENLSPDTFVCMKTYNANGKLIQYEGIPIEKIKTILNCHEVSYDLKDDAGKVYGKQVCIFKQPEHENPLSVGLIPTALAIMLKKRKEARKLMEQCTDDAQKSVYNGLQLAYKVVANSIYGQLGSKTSAIRKVCIAACTTAVGRRQLLFAKQTVEDEFGAEVVYGDSVTRYTPVFIRHNGCNQFVPIELLDAYGKGWKQYGDKEMCELEGVESWTEKGWTPVERVIRHALAPHKQIIRVATGHGVVDVTDDHSLVRGNGEPVSARDLIYGMDLLHHSLPMPSITNTCTLTEEEASLQGFFAANGMCQVHSWAVYATYVPVLKQYKQICERLYPHMNWDIIPTLEDTDILGVLSQDQTTYKLCPEGNAADFIAYYRKRMYTSDGQRQIPNDILNSPLRIRRAFWTGLHSVEINIYQNKQLLAAQIAYLSNTLGLRYAIQMYKNKFIIHQNYAGSHCIVGMKQIEYSGYVYDLTTQNHHFQAGIGKLIVHNTDSIFVKFPGKNLEETIRAGQQAAEYITSRCPHKAFVIGYEKTFYPFILFCRKRYVGMKYEEDPTQCKRASMGIVLKRRDNAPIVKDVFGGALDILLEHKNVHKSVEYVKTMLLKVIRGELPLEKFAITKQLRDDYKDPTRIAHRVLADRMAKRDPGNKPNIGDRLKFVYIRSDKKLQGDKIEEISYVKDKKATLDTLFYITNQIQNPVSQLFALCIEKIEGYAEPSPSYRKRYEEYLAKLGDQEEATLRVLADKERQLDKLLFLGADYLRNPIRSTRTGPMDMFVVSRK